MRWSWVPFALACIGFVFISAGSEWGAQMAWKLKRFSLYGDKIGHIGLFALLGATATWATGFARFRAFGLALPVGAVVVLLIGTIDEFSQQYFPARVFSYWDLLANYIGLSLGCLTAYLMAWLYKKLA